MAEPTYPNLPHFLEGSAQQITEFRVGDHGRELDIVAMVAKASVDAGSSPTTKLRKGLVVGWKDASDMFIDLPSADAPAAATLVSSAAVTWANMVDKTLLFRIGAEAIQTATMGAADDTQAEVIAAFNAVDARIQMAASGATMMSVSLIAVGSQHNFEFTSGTGLAVINFDSEIHRGSDMTVGILNDQCETTHDSVTYDIGPARLCITGKVLASKVYGLDGVNGGYAKEALIKSGVIFV